MNDLSIEEGNLVILQTRSGQTSQALEEATDTLIDEWNVLDIQTSGSYQLQSNQWLTVIISAGTVFLSLAFLIGMAMYMKGRRAAVIIWHYHGWPGFHIWRYLYFPWLLTLFFQGILVFLGFSVLSTLNVIPTWNERWLLEGGLSMALLFTTIIGMSLWHIRMVIKKGGAQ